MLEPVDGSESAYAGGNIGWSIGIYSRGSWPPNQDPSASFWKTVGNGVASGEVYMKVCCSTFSTTSSIQQKGYFIAGKQDEILVSLFGSLLRAGGASRSSATRCKLPRCHLCNTTEQFGLCGSEFCRGPARDRRSELPPPPPPPPPRGAPPGRRHRLAAAAAGRGCAAARCSVSMAAAQLRGVCCLLSAWRRADIRARTNRLKQPLNAASAEHVLLVRRLRLLQRDLCERAYTYKPHLRKFYYCAKQLPGPAGASRATALSAGAAAKPRRLR